MSCPRFVAESLALRTAIHILHLTTRSYAEHVALGDFYDKLTELTDRYAESYMGEHDNVTLPSVKPPTGTAREVLLDYLDLVRDELDEDQDSATKQTILAEIEELVLSTLYKLKLK